MRIELRCAASSKALWLLRQSRPTTRRSGDLARNRAGRTRRENARPRTTVAYFANGSLLATTTSSRLRCGQLSAVLFPPSAKQQHAESRRRGSRRSQHQLSHRWFAVRGAGIRREVTEPLSVVQSALEQLDAAGSARVRSALANPLSPRPTPGLRERIREMGFGWTALF